MQYIVTLCIFIHYVIHHNNVIHYNNVIQCNTFFGKGGEHQDVDQGCSVSVSKQRDLVWVAIEGSDVVLDPL